MILLLIKTKSLTFRFEERSACNLVWMPRANAHRFKASFTGFMLQGQTLGLVDLNSRQPFNCRRHCLKGHLAVIFPCRPRGVALEASSTRVDIPASMPMVLKRCLKPRIGFKAVPRDGGSPIEFYGNSRLGPRVRQHLGPRLALSLEQVDRRPHRSGRPCCAAS
jgi:hypothetical protein